MNELSVWFTGQLQSSADGIVWAVHQVPSQRQFVLPPPNLGDWSPARHVFHLLYYERFVLPIMRQWLGADPPSLAGFDEDGAWRQEHGDIETLCSQFLDGRKKQIQLLSEFKETHWSETRETTWGPVTLLWTISKTFQHTAEHVNEIMQMALFWEIGEGTHESAAGGPAVVVEGDMPPLTEEIVRETTERTRR